MNSKTRILERLRQGQAQQATAVNHGDLPAMPRLPETAWKARFIELMTANHAQVIECNRANWIGQLVELLQQKRLDQLCLGQSPANLELADVLASRLPELRLSRFDQALEAYADSRMRVRLFTEMSAGFSRATAALAETGTLVVATGAEEPRTLSLVPPLSIILLHQADLVSGFAELIEQPRWQGKLPTNLLLISGPSKTADIQQTLAYGAHGPKELVVLLVDECVQDECVQDECASD
jgi:L-lactate dehydrogenase complex protein LldG